MPPSRAMRSSGKKRGAFEASRAFGVQGRSSFGRKKCREKWRLRSGPDAPKDCTIPSHSHVEPRHSSALRCLASALFFRRRPTRHMTARVRVSVVSNSQGDEYVSVRAGVHPSVFDGPEGRRSLAKHLLQQASHLANRGRRRRAPESQQEGHRRPMPRGARPPAACALGGRSRRRHLDREHRGQSPNGASRGGRDEQRIGSARGGVEDARILLVDEHIGQQRHAERRLGHEAQHEVCRFPPRPSTGLRALLRE